MISLIPDRLIDQSAIRALDAWLQDNHYSPHCRARVIRHVERTGELAGAVLTGHLEPDDEAAATEVLIDALEPVAGDDPAWDDEGVIFDAEMLAAGNHPWPIPVEGDDDRAIPPDAAIVPPELEPYDPTPEDQADYAAWLADRESGRPAVRSPDGSIEPSDRYSVDSLIAIRRALWGIA